jgi:predicted transcriptional regulator
MIEALARLEEMNARFQAAHEAGLAALEHGDLQGLDDAIACERAVIDEMAAHLEAMKRGRLP